jgi:hypothetical protein
MSDLDDSKALQEAVKEQTPTKEEAKGGKNNKKNKKKKGKNNNIELQIEDKKEEEDIVNSTPNITYAVAESTQEQEHKHEEIKHE